MNSAILYICDQKKCEVCNPECKHTSDITHAANFKPEQVQVDGQVRISAYFERAMQLSAYRDCSTCKYECVSQNESPCYDCSYFKGYNNWEKKDE